MTARSDASGVYVDQLDGAPANPLPTLAVMSSIATDPLEWATAVADAVATLALMSAMGDEVGAREGLRQVLELAAGVGAADELARDQVTAGHGEATPSPALTPAAIIDAARRRPPHPAQLAADLRDAVATCGQPSTRPVSTATARTRSERARWRPVAGHSLLATLRQSACSTTARLRRPLPQMRVRVVAVAAAAAIAITAGSRCDDGPAQRAGAPSTAVVCPTPAADLPADPTSVTTPGDLDGDGCDEAVRWWPSAAVASLPDGTRFALGRPGDQLLLGDWNADGLDTPALYRPATGTVLTFDSWATDGDVTATAHDAEVTGGLASVQRWPAGDKVVVAGPPPG